MKNRRELILGAVELMLSMPVDSIHAELGDGAYVRMANASSGLHFHGEVNTPPDNERLRSLLLAAVDELDRAK